MLRIIRIAGALIAFPAKAGFVGNQEVAGSEAAVREATPQEAQIYRGRHGDSGYDRVRLFQGIGDHADIRIQGNASGEISENGPDDVPWQR